MKNPGRAFSIKEHFKRFSALDQFLWLQAIIIHPNNQRYIPRVEYLIGILFSTPENEFSFRIPTQKDMEFLHHNTQKEFNEIFVALEDFEGFDQRKPVPTFIDGEQYFPFNSGLERPVEFYRHIADLYFHPYTVEEDEELYRLKHQYLRSLEFQTTLLLKMLEMEESKVKQEGLYVPTKEFVDALRPYFIAAAISTPCLNLGMHEGKGLDAILDLVPSFDLFNDALVSIGSNSYYLYPHIHFNIFFKKCNLLLMESKERRKSVHSCFQDRLYNICLNFFSNKHNVVVLLPENSGENILEGKVDYAAFTDGNKLMLFAAVPHSTSFDSSKQLNSTIDNLKEVRDVILNNRVVGIGEQSEKKIYGVLVEMIEVILVPVSETTTINSIAGTNQETTSADIFPFAMMDLKAIFNNLQKPFHFLKFLREEKALLKGKRSTFMGEFMDRFAYYIQNNRSYTRSGMSFDLMLFEPHIWHFHMMQELYEKHKDTAYAAIEKKFPGFFNIQQKVFKGVYSMMSTAHFDGAYLIRHQDRDIWIFGQRNGYDQNDMDIRAGYDLLMPMLADYLKQFENAFRPLFNKILAFSENSYSIQLVPLSEIETGNSFVHLRPHLKRFNALAFDTRRYEGLRIKTLVIFDSEELIEWFVTIDNSGERRCVKGLVESILLFSGVGATKAEGEAQAFIDINMPIGKKGYSLESLEVDNPQLAMYRPPKEFNDTDISIVNRKVSEFFIHEGFEPREYRGDQVRVLNARIYNFLQQMLEEEISGFGEQLLRYAYAELEFALGAYEGERLNIGMKEQSRTSFNVLEYYKEREMKLSELKGAIQLIIHTYLKIAPQGEKLITGEDWTKLLAIARVNMHTTMMHDYILYDIREHSLTINSSYVLEDNFGEENIDNSNMVLDRARLKLDDAISAYKDAASTKPPEVTVESTEPTPDSDSLILLNKAFIDDLGFGFDNLLFTLYACYRSILNNEETFPLRVCTLSELYSVIQIADHENIDYKEFKRIINFLTLDHSVYPKAFSLILSNMMRYRHRLNVSPFIRLTDGRILIGNESASNSYKYWFQTIECKFPFETKSYPNISKALKLLHNNQDKQLEKVAEHEAIRILGKDNVEARILNFKRLSDNFLKRPPCGEIDLLAVNRETKTLFVLDAKNIVKRTNPYFIRQNIDEFFKGPKSYSEKLKMKHHFVEENASEILKHFKIMGCDAAEWIIKSAFVSETVYFASYLIAKNTDFININEMEKYFVQS